MKLQTQLRVLAHINSRLREPPSRKATRTSIRTMLQLTAAETEQALQELKRLDLLREPHTDDFRIIGSQKAAMTKHDLILAAREERDENTHRLPITTLPQPECIAKTPTRAEQIKAALDWQKQRQQMQNDLLAVHEQMNQRTP